MPGYPNKISRTSLGPTYQNAAKVGSPEEEADAGVFNLLCWQVAGLNVVSPRGIIIGQCDNASIALIKQWFAWDPEGQLPAATLARTGVGTYTWALPGTAQYNDMNGNPVTVTIDFVQATIQGSTARTVIADLDTDQNSGTMFCFLSGAAAEIGGAGVFKRFMLVLM